MSKMLAAVVVALVLTVSARAGSVLDGLKPVAGPVVVDTVVDDLSGITFNPDTGTLFAIRNGEPRVFELDRDGKLLRAFDLTGFEDTEDLACLGGGQLAIIEERRRTLAVVAIPAGAEAVARPADVVTIDPAPAKNLGLEGVALDAKGGRFFLVKEKEPQRLYTLPLKGTAQDVAQPWDVQAKNFGLQDLSAVAMVPATGNLLLLSDESRTVVECTPAGREVGRLVLPETAVQPEGLTLDDRGRLYVVCEPNVLYVFAKP